MKPTHRIKCPTCRKEGDWFAGQYGPFCSHRCKLVDLGKWFGEELRISEPLPSSDLGPDAGLAPGEPVDRPDQVEADQAPERVRPETSGRG